MYYPDNEKILGITRIHGVPDMLSLCIEYDGVTSKGQGCKNLYIGPSSTMPERYVPTTDEDGDLAILNRGNGELFKVPDTSATF